MKLTRLTRNIRKVLWLSSLMAIGVVGMFANAGESPFADALNLLPDDEKGIKKSKVSDNPLHIASTNIPAYVMIVLGRDHNLFTEAYNDYTALKDEANAPLNIMFDPSIEYYGLFDSDLCYAIEGDNLDVTYDGTKDSKQYFYPVDSVKLYPDKLNRAEWSDSLDKTKTELVEVKVCDDQWSGNFLNYVTTARIDIVRKILYGGTRIRSKEADVIDGVGDNKGVVLKHSNVLADAHSWAKVFSPKMYNNKLQFKHFIGERAPSNAEAIFLGVGSWSDGGDGDPSDYTTYNVERAAFLRYGWVENAGIPGEHSVSNINKTYVWDWASVEQAFGLITDETNKLEKIFINKKAYTKMLHVVVCTKDFPTDESCYNYGTVEAPSWRPIGILQEYEVNPKGKVKFGLITGKWKQNFGYGALRANIGDFSDEVNTDGSFDYTKSSGFVDTLDKFRIARHNNFNGDKQYYDCKRQDIGKDEKISQGACTDWGNPVSKLLYLATQYFINSESVTTNGTSISKDSTIFDTTGDLLDLKYAERKDPYSDDAYYCAKPSTLLIADENITFDGDIYDMNNATITDEVNLIGQYENLLDKSYLMGYSASDASNTYKYLPTSKLIKKLSDVVGLAPSVAQSFGSYNVAGVAKHFSNKDRLTIKGKNNNSKNTSIETYVVAMKPNMPELKIQIDNDLYATLVPMAISPNYKGRSYAVNQPVDFYVEKLTPTSGTFRINFEDAQYGADYDMDWIVEYKYWLIEDKHKKNKYIRVQLRDISGDGYAHQKAGYVLTGVENPGVYFDLGKPSAGGLDGHGEENNKNNAFFSLDNPISDFNMISDYSKQSTSWTKKAGWCWRESPNYDSDDNFDAKLTQMYYDQINSNVDAYYSSKIEPRKEQYYGKRTETPSDYNENTAKTALLGTPTRCYYVDGASASSRTFKVDSTNANDVFLKSPLWYAAKYGLETKQESADDPINYYLVTNPSKLKDGISQMLSQITSAVHSSSTFSTEKLITHGGESVYGTQFDPSSWWGNVIGAYVSASSDGGYAKDESGEFITKWEASKTFEEYAKPENLNKRLILTRDSVGNLKRIWSDVTNDSNGAGSAYQNLGMELFNKIANTSYTGTTITSDSAKNAHKYMNRFVRWYAGEKDFESEYDKSLVVDGFNDGRPFRIRVYDKKHFVLGDIIDSDAVFFKPVDSEPVVVVGANDGMLHFLDAEDGDPLLSYVPTEMLGSIHKLAKQSYVSLDHTYMVNSTPQIYQKGTKTIIYGTYGNSFKGGYAINATNIRSITTSNYSEHNDFVLWELPGSNSFVGKMSYPPTLINLIDDNNKKKEYLVYSSGFDSISKGIFVVDLFDPDAHGNYPNIVKTIEFKDGDVLPTDPLGLDRQNAIAPVTVVQLDPSKNRYDAMYAGDYFGNLWKVGISSNKLSSISTSPKILFKSVDQKGAPQPITSRIGTGYADGGVVLVYGTGSFVKNIDVTELSHKYNSNQSIYGIRDLTTSHSVSSMKHSGPLVRCQDTSINEASIKNCLVESRMVASGPYRSYQPKVSPAQFNVYGFYIDLTLNNETTSDHKPSPLIGERVYTDPLLIGEKMFITTNIPNINDPCLGSGSSSLITGNIVSGYVSEEVRFSSLAKSPVVTIHNGKIVVHVPLDPVSPDTPKGGTPMVQSIPLENQATREGSIIKLY